MAAQDVQIERHKSKSATTTAATRTITTDSTSADIDMSLHASLGYVITATTGGAATLTFYGACCLEDTRGNRLPGTYGQIYDSTNVAVTLTLTSGKAYKLPDDCFPFGFVQIRCDAGTVTIELSQAS